jgi:ADP-ribose pyrophosphatase YjhB (NUDIX family)
MREKHFCHFCGHTLIRKHWEGRDRLFCNFCDQPLYENPVPAACLIVLDETERLLLVKRSVNPKKGLWCLPGGFMELGETPDETALRELKEETGLSARIDRILGVDSNSNALYGTVTLICYLVWEYHGNPAPGDDADDLDFFPVNNLPELAFESHRKFIRRYYEKKMGVSI